MEYLLYYVLFTGVMFILMSLFSILENKMELDEKQKQSRDELFKLNVTFSFIPIINILYLLLLVCLCLLHFKDFKQNRKERKFHPEKSSFKTLKEILCLYTDSYANDHFSKFIEKLKENTEILKTKLDDESYKKLLKKYEFTFARIISILEESSKLNENTQNKVLLTSKELIDGFLEEFQQLLDKDNEIESKTEEVILNRFMKELEEEKIIQSRQMKYTKIS